jgi:hypothetical protein
VGGVGGCDCLAGSHCAEKRETGCAVSKIERRRNHGVAADALAMQYFVNGLKDLGLIARP